MKPTINKIYQLQARFAKTTKIVSQQEFEALTSFSASVQHVIDKMNRNFPSSELNACNENAL